MAGVLPGVESARRRRLRGSSGWSDSSSVISSGFGSARNRLCHESHLNPTSFLQRSSVNQSDEDEKLGGAAREAKERLEGRLRGHLKPETRRQISQEGLASASFGRRQTTTMVIQNLGMDVFGSKKSGTKRFTWGKKALLNWKSSNQDECAICLDQFKADEKLARLPCAHRFHYNCLLPWLESNERCPCCRTVVFGCN